MSATRPKPTLPASRGLRVDEAPFGEERVVEAAERVRRGQVHGREQHDPQRPEPRDGPLAHIEQRHDRHRRGHQDDPGAVAGWLAVTARREAMRTLQRGVRELPSAEPPEPRKCAPAPEAVAVERERRDRAARGDRAALRPPARAAEPAREPARFSYEDVSRELGMPIGSIGPTRERAFERLRADTALATAVAA